MSGRAGVPRTSSGLAVSAGIYAAFLWPRVEPQDEVASTFTADITRDKASTPVKFARVTDGQPPPSATPGRKPGEWYVAWLDNEVQARSLVTYLTTHWAERFGLVGVG